MDIEEDLYKKEQKKLTIPQVKKRCLSGRIFMGDNIILVDERVRK